MDHGRIIASGTPPELIAQHVPPRVVEVQASHLDPAAVTTIVSHLVDRSEVVSDRVVLYTRDSAPVVRALREAGVEGAVIERDATLEDVFLRLTGHALVE
jgi:lipooligosaccharide transport system ATP-binding protein